jgi:hypothetical protein
MARLIMVVEVLLTKVLHTCPRQSRVPQCFTKAVKSWSISTFGILQHLAFDRGTGRGIDLDLEASDGASVEMT